MSSSQVKKKSEVVEIKGINESSLTDLHPARMARQIIKTEPQHHLAVCHCTVAQAFSVPLAFLFVEQLKNYLLPHIKIRQVSWYL